MSENNTPSKPGPKPYLNKTRQREICAILSIGGTRTMAAYYVGCTRETIRHTAQNDRSFAEQLWKSEIGTEIVFLKNIKKAAKDASQWRAAAWALERLHPDRYARRQPHTITRPQLAEFLRELGDKLVRDVPAGDDRRLLLARLKKATRAARKRIADKRGRARQRFGAEKA